MGSTTMTMDWLMKVGITMPGYGWTPILTVLMMWINSNNFTNGNLSPTGQEMKTAIGLALVT